MGLIFMGQTCDFMLNNILNYRVFRQTEGHENDNNNGKTLLLTKLSKNINNKYTNNQNCKVFKYPIFGGPIFGYSNGRWFFDEIGGVF